MQLNLFEQQEKRKPKNKGEPKYPISTGNPDKVKAKVFVEFTDGSSERVHIALLQGFWLKHKSYGAPLCLDGCQCPKRFKHCTKPGDLKMLASVIESETGKIIDIIHVERVWKERE